MTGLRENFSEDRGIEEPYWRPSKYVMKCKLFYMYIMGKEAEKHILS